MTRCTDHDGRLTPLKMDARSEGGGTAAAGYTLTIDSVFLYDHEIVHSLSHWWQTLAAAMVASHYDCMHEIMRSDNK